MQLNNLDLASNLKIRENTGAKIKINDDGTEVTIRGTYGQCEVAKSRIEVYLDDEAKKPRPGVYPELGLTILDTSRAMLSAADKGISSRVTPKVYFRRYNLEDNNGHSKGAELFYITFNREDSNAETSEIFKDCNEIDGTEASTVDVYDLLFETTPEIILNKLNAKRKSNQSIWGMKKDFNYGNGSNDVNVSQAEWEPNVLAPTPQYPFSIFPQLTQCMTQITSRISELFPVSDPGTEIRVSLYLGRELFFNVPIEPSSYTLSEWCKLRRIGQKSIKTSFQHNAPLVDGLRILQTDMGFQEETESFGESEEDKWSITIYFDDGEDKKMKLNWDYQKRTWKVTKVVKSLRRIILLDLLSGSYLPDIRFLVKTQIRIPIDQKLVDIIEVLQNSISRDENNMSFLVKDFAGILNVTRIKQTISKRRFYNKDYRISIVPTKQDPDGTRITYGNNVIIKHLDWIKMNKYQTQFYKNSLKNCTTKSSTSQHLHSSPPLSRSSSIHSSPPSTPYEQQESNTYNVVNQITEEFDLISFDDESPTSYISPAISTLNKTCHLLDDNQIGFNQVKHILDDDSPIKIQQHILDNDDELKNQRHILDDDYEQNEQNDYYRYEYENFKKGELQNYEETGIEGQEFIEEKNWKDILELTIPITLEYAREFCRIVS